MHDGELVLSDGSDLLKEMRMDLVPGFKKHGLVPPPKRQAIGVLRKNLRDALNKYDYFYEG